MSIDEVATLELTRPADGVLLVTLNRPDRLNAMTEQMFRELEDVARSCNEDDPLRVVIVTGAGAAFCAGYDLADADKIASLGAIGFLDLQELAARALAAVRNIRAPVIAAVNGAASGGGLALALAADIRLAAPTAKFNAAMVRIGLSIGDLGSSWLLNRLIGPAAAAEFAFTAEVVDADRARELGLVNHVVQAEDLLPAALDLARRISANPPAGIRLSKRALQASQEISSYAAALEMENRGQAMLVCTEDMPEALAAFRERRPPRFTGR